MTVLIYVDTSRPVGDPDHIKMFASQDAPRKLGSRRTIPKAWRSSMRFWNESVPDGAVPTASRVEYFSR